MAREYSRTQRLGEQMQRELAQLIQRELKDPRVGMVTVSAVEVSRDLAHAKVFVTVLDPDRDPESTVKALDNAAGFLRRELGRHMVMRTIPQLKFVYDASVERGSALSRLIDEAVARDRDKGDN